MCRRADFVRARRISGRGLSHRAVIVAGRSSIDSVIVSSRCPSSAASRGCPSTSAFHLGAGSTRRLPRLPLRHALRLAAAVVRVEVGRLYPPPRRDFFKGGSRVRVAAQYPCRADRCDCRWLVRCRPCRSVRGHGSQRSCEDDARPGVSAVERRVCHHLPADGDCLGGVVLAGGPGGGSVRSGRLLHRGHRHGGLGWRHVV